MGENEDIFLDKSESLCAPVASFHTSKRSCCVWLWDGMNIIPRKSFQSHPLWSQLTLLNSICNNFLFLSWKNIFIAVFCRSRRVTFNSWSFKTASCQMSFWFGAFCTGDRSRERNKTVKRKKVKEAVCVWGKRVAQLVFVKNKLHLHAGLGAAFCRYILQR